MVTATPFGREMSDDLFWVGVLAWLVGVLGSAVGIFFGVAASGKADSNSRSKLLTMLHLSVVACFFGVLLAFNGLLMASKAIRKAVEAAVF